MSENKNASGKNSLTVPLILSLCMNLVLIVAIVVMAITMMGKVSGSSETTTAESTAVTETAEETDSDETEEETSYFETDDGERVEVVAADDVYINSATYICAGDESEWNFTYDSDTGVTSVEVDVDGTTATYTFDFYVTTDEDNARLVAQLVDEDGNAASLCYLSNLVDDDDTILGMVLEMVSDSDEKILLCTEDYWATYQAELNGSDEDDSAAEETATPEETESAEDAE